MVSSPSTHDYHLLFYCVSSILAFILLALMKFFCTAIKRFLVSPLRCPFRSHVQVFSREISLVCLLKYLFSCFSTHFCLFVIVLCILILSVMLLIALISLSLFFLSCLRVSVLMHPCYLQYWRVFFHFLFLIQIVCLCHFLIHIVINISRRNYLKLCNFA